MGSGPRHTATPTWSARDHVIGVLLGVAFLAVQWGQTYLQGVLQRDMQTFARTSALWEMFAVDLAFGIVVALVVVASRRWPALPSTVLAVMAYGVLADPWSPLRGWALPDLGPWLPRLTGFVGEHGRWDTSEVLLVLGIMLVATVWGWTRPLRTRRAISSALPVDDTPTGDGDGATDSVRNPDGVRDV